MNLDWQAEGVCSTDKSLGPDDFFFEGKYLRNSPEYRAAVRKAKRACASCPVRATCLEFALEHHQDFGIWGGLTPAERKLKRYPRRRINGRYVYDSRGRAS